MLSLGDEREAAAGADLTYHSARVVDLGCVTFRAAALQGSLTSTDHWMKERLAERGLRADYASPPPCAEAAASLSGDDWWVVRFLCAGRGGVWTDDGKSGLDSPEALEHLRRGGGMPLVGYVADECHGFATADEVHDEQSFLDTCRSFGTFCVLACQSVYRCPAHKCWRGPGFGLGYGAVGRRAHPRRPAGLVLLIYVCITY